MSKLTWKQKSVIQFCIANDGITKKDAMELINDHYCNGSKHVGDVLSRMVKAGLLIREKPGVFKLGTGTRDKPSNQPENQTKLF